ncbi:hypothetical protein B0H14DRAFT_3082561 [Mycena olivaceomarginata]|nr:hypothetical protein B0H14DRAFT_3082561 [Mycena olivaceomarginata]
MVNCPGCNVYFNGGKGLSLHLRLTTNETCHAIFTAANADLGALPANFAQPSDLPQEPDDIEEFGELHGLPASGTEFQGDFFGDNYGEDDFGYQSDGRDDDSENEGSDDDEEDPTARDHQDASHAEMESGYEAPRAAIPSAVNGDTFMPAAQPEVNPAPTREARKLAEDKFHHKPVIEKYPGRLAGRSISVPSLSSEESYGSALGDSTRENPYAPFKSKVDWEIAKWAQTARFANPWISPTGLSVQLNKIIDDKLPSRPKFTRSEVVVNGEVFLLYSRDILECVRALWGETDFAPYLFVVPEKHYIDKGKTIRMYHNMHTGKWWWSTQEAVEKDNPGATIIPIIISSDKTQLTVFGNKTAYPVYMTIGNIPQEIRRKPPVAEAGKTGIPITSGDGVTRRGHPIYATFVGDYPEQVLVTAVKTGECPTCEPSLTALDALDEGPTIYAQACADAGIKPIYHPFWEGLPYTNIYRAISPDILHQLYQGVIKHLIAWVTACSGEAEVDALTGKEHDQISRFLLSLVIDIQLPDGHSSSKLVGAVRALLDFVYLAQYPMHTSETLAHLDNALQRFHDTKSIFVDLGVRDEFNLPKLHSCRHYTPYIKSFGTTDNYNTEYTERLHIDLAKEAYRSTNFKDEFPQMTLWLERKEKIYRHENYIQWRLDGCPSPPVIDDIYPGIVFERQLKMTKHPTLKSVRMSRLVTDYGATLFRDALARYVVHLNNPDLSPLQDLSFAFNSVPVYHRIKFTTQDPYSAPGGPDSVVDSIHVQPCKTLKNGEDLPARFDTALVNGGNGQITGVAGYRVVQVHVIFSLQARHIRSLFSRRITPPKYLAYVEWFSPFKDPEADHLMYKVNRSMKDGYRRSSIIPVVNIRRSVHLLPKFGPVAPADWKSSNVLDKCSHFFVNSLTDRHIYATLF